MASLSIISGKKVWSINVETSVISNGGNLIDNIFLCVMISLLHFRKP
jgi:exosome complex RNA-binding protein Rrp42 (RNase PH superfamily)